ncbi:MAG: LPS export ABC transporter periplasmic protein LptC [Gloeomargarita sp. SKYBB_i_bin120]|nr:LPS export ABC transporter periplasmic protein LptC [Gloeomargarita sp. SKYG98]MCS7293339.1 LPS export ABC transporter periplasmic protein LptC [Gloeomargarita sp. SKYB120]MDW8178904.1 LPS export ABC transporter periplasmic protein LptC [Gloeomargarita sp. SKYBB_i_bin120]
MPPTTALNRRTERALWGALLALGLAGCRVPERPLEPEAPPEASQQLTFESLNLHQVDKTGQTVWKLQAQKAVADVRTRRVTAQQVVGNIYSQGKPRYRVRAAQAVVQQQQETLTVQGDITAEDVQDPTVIKARSLVWRPAQREILLQGNLEFRQPQLQVQAQEATIRLRDNRLSVRRRVQVTSRKPVLQIKGEALDWQWRDGLVQARQPVQILYTPEQLVVKAGVGLMDFPRQVLRLNQGVEAVHRRGRLRAQVVEWRIAQQDIIASGDVVYTQTDPPLTVSGAQAQGNLATRQIRVTRARTQVRLE